MSDKTNGSCEHPGSDVAVLPAYYWCSKCGALRHRHEENWTLPKQPLSGYNRVKAEINNLPVTWYPALLMEMVQAAIQNRVFKPGRVSEFVKEIEEKTLQANKQTS